MGWNPAAKTEILRFRQTVIYLFTVSAFSFSLAEDKKIYFYWKQKQFLR